MTRNIALWSTVVILALGITAVTWLCLIEPEDSSTRQYLPAIVSNDDWIAAGGDFAAAPARQVREAVGPRRAVETTLHQQTQPPDPARDQDARSRCVLSGVVRDAGGWPLAGVLVSAFRSDSALAEPATVTSDHRGAFHIAELPSGSYWLMATSDLHLSARIRVHLRPGERKEGLGIELAAGRDMSGRVVDDRGLPIGGAIVECHGLRRVDGGVREASARSVTDDAGFFVLAGVETGTVLMTASASNHRSVTEFGVDMGKGAVTLILERLGSLSGMLRDASGRPVAGSRIRLAPELASAFEAILHTSADVADVARSLETRTAEDGRFLFSNVPPGRFVLHAEGAHRPIRRPGVLVDQGKETANLELIVEPSLWLDVAVTDPDDNPVAGATVYASTGIEPKSIATAERILCSEKTDRRGNARLRGLPASIIRVTASSEGWLDAHPLNVAVSADGGRTRLVLRRGAFAEVITRDAEGRPIGNQEFCLRKVDEPPTSPLSRLGRTGRTDGTARTRLGPLPVGTYAIVLVRAGRPAVDAAVFPVLGREIGSTRKLLTLEEGTTTEIELTCPVLARLHGIVADEAGVVDDASIEAWSVDEPSVVCVASARSDATGSYVLADLLPGKYVLRVHPRGAQVPHEEALELPPNVGDLRRDIVLSSATLRLRVTDGSTGEPVAKARIAIRRCGVQGGIGVASDPATTGVKKTDARGVVQLRIPSGSYVVTARHAERATTEIPDVQVPADALVELTIVLQRSGEILVRVLRQGGGPAGLFQLRHRRAGSRETATLTLGQGGQKRLTGLSPGTWVLQARCMPVAATVPGGGWGDEVQVVVRAGSRCNATVHAGH